MPPKRRISGPVGQSLRGAYGIRSKGLDGIRYNVGLRAIRRRCITAMRMGKITTGRG